MKLHTTNCPTIAEPNIVRRKTNLTGKNYSHLDVVYVDGEREWCLWYVDVVACCGRWMRLIDVIGGCGWWWWLVGVVGAGGW